MEWQVDILALVVREDLAEGKEEPCGDLEKIML